MELNGKMQSETNLYRSLQERYRQCQLQSYSTFPMAIRVTRDNGRRVRSTVLWGGLSLDDFMQVECDAGDAILK